MDRYQFPDGEIFEIQSEADLTEFRDGHPFTYPALVLKNVHGEKTRVVPKYNLDMLAKRIPFPLQEIDSLDKFVEYFELATRGKFTKHINSFKNEEYAQYKESVHKWIDNYDKGFQNGKLSKESKSMLEAFAMMLFVSLEMAAAEKVGKLRPQPEPKE